MSVNVGLLHLPCLAARNTLSYFEGSPPLGLAYIAASLRAAGYSPFVLDALGEATGKHSIFPSAMGDLVVQGYNVDEIVERIPSDLDVLGIGNIFLHEVRFLADLLPALRAKLPNLTIVLGGENATGMWDDLLKMFPQVTGCILGEGEQAFPAFLKVLEEGRGLHEAPSLGYRVNGEPVQNPRAQRIAAIDNLPLPAWDLFPIEKYLEARIGSGVYRGPSLPLLTSRGCPYTCTFCSSPAMWGTTYWARSPAHVVNEIELQMRRYGVTNFDFRDLSSILKKNWIREFHAEVKARNLQFTWQIPQGTRSENLNRETLQLMYESGCRNFGYALESVSPHVITRMKKKVVPERLFGSIREALRLRMRLDIFFIIGYPGETFWDHLAYLRAMVRLAVMGADAVSIMQFNPYPGSEDFFDFRKRGHIHLEDDGYVYSSLFRTRGQYAKIDSSFSNRYLLAFETVCLGVFWALQFIIRPWRVFRLLRNFVRAEQETVLDQFLAVKARQWGSLRRKLRGAAWGGLARRRESLDAGA